MNTLAIDQEMLNGSVDAGFVLALPFHHRDLEPDCRSLDEGGLFAEHYGTSVTSCLQNPWDTAEVNQLGYYVLDLHARRYGQKITFFWLFYQFYIKEDVIKD